MRVLLLLVAWLLSCVVSVAGTGPLSLNSSDVSTAWSQLWDGVRAGGVCSVVTASVVDPNDGSVVSVGYASGTYLSHASAGLYDAFATKTSSAGVTLWTRWFATPQNDLLMGVCIDAASQVYLSGTTTGYMLGQTNAGSSDHFTVSLDATGSQRWVQQFGTSQPEFAGACGVDSFGGVYFVGFGSGGLFTTTYSGYWGVYVLRAASSSGVTTWGHNTNVGKSEQFLYAQALNYDPFVCGVWSTGGEVWGAAASWSGGQLPAGRGLVVLPPVNGSSTVPLVVISFWTDDTTSFVDQPVTGAGGFDSIVAAYNGLTGAFVWSDTYATPYDDMAYGIATDPTGAVWVTGYTSANLDGGAYSGTPNSQTDVFLSKLTLNGTKLFTVLYGSATNSEAGTAVASDSAGGIYVAGVSAYAATTVMMDAQPNPYTAVTSSMSGSAVVGFLSKFDSDGARLLTYLLSAYTPVTQANAVTPFLAPLSLAADTKSGAVYLSGRLEGLWGAETYPSGTASLTDIMCDQAFLVSVQQPPTNCSILQFDQLLTQINSLLAQL